MTSDLGLGEIMSGDKTRAERYKLKIDRIGWVDGRGEERSPSDEAECKSSGEDNGTWNMTIVPHHVFGTDMAGDEVVSANKGVLHPIPQSFPSHQTHSAFRPIITSVCVCATCWHELGFP